MVFSVIENNRSDKYYYSTEPINYIDYKLQRSCYINILKNNSSEINLIIYIQLNIPKIYRKL